MGWVTASSTCYALHGHHPLRLIVLTQQDTHLRAGANFQSPQIGLNHWWRIISVSNKLSGQPTSLSSLTYCDSSNLQFHCVAHRLRGAVGDLALVSENRNSFVQLRRPHLRQMSQGSSLASLRFVSLSSMGGQALDPSRTKANCEVCSSLHGCSFHWADPSPSSQPLKGMWGAHWLLSTHSFAL